MAATISAYAQVWCELQYPVVLVVHCRLKPRSGSLVTGFADAAIAPIDFPTAPAEAIPKVSQICSSSCVASFLVYHFYERVHFAGSFESLLYCIAGIVNLVERWTRDRKVARLIPSRDSRVNSLC